jgi:hypothetical protein
MTVLSDNLLKKHHACHLMTLCPGESRFSVQRIPAPSSLKIHDLPGHHYPTKRSITSLFSFRVAHVEVQLRSGEATIIIRKPLY